MKKISIIPYLGFLVCCGLTGCDIGGESWIREELTLNIEAWTLKDTSKANVPYNLDLASSIDNTCTSNFEFIVARASKFQYFVFAKATFESHGEDCFYQFIFKDTTVNIIPDTIGKYYYYFYYNDAFNVDSISIIP